MTKTIEINFKDMIILALFINSGSNRNLSFERIQVNLLYVACENNFDIVIAVKFTVHNSKCNMTERYISILNISMATFCYKTYTKLNILQKISKMYLK